MIADYLWDLLRSALRAVLPSDVRIWVDTLASSLADLKQAIYSLRRAWVLATAAGEALDLHGQDRGLPRYPGETDDLYRRRLQAAYYIYAMGGTNDGLKEALRVLGYPNAEIYELFKDGVVTPLHNGQSLYNAAAAHRGGNRWAEFKVLTDIEQDRPFTANDLALAKQTIKKTKASHSKLAAFVLKMVLPADFLTMEDTAHLNALWQPVDGIASPLVSHSGSSTRNGAYHYTAGRIYDELKLSIRARPQFAEVLPGTMTRQAARHDGAGGRWKHAGSMLRKPLIKYGGTSLHNGLVSRRTTQNHYGDRRATHNGLRTYGWGVKRSGTYGANGPKDGLTLALKRRGQVIEEWTA